MFFAPNWRPGFPKSVFQLAVADAPWRVVETHRLTRPQFERWFVNRDVSLVIMEACREFGIAIPTAARTGIEAISRVLADPCTAVPDLIRGTGKLLVEEVRLLEARIAQLERELAALARLSPSNFATRLIDHHGYQGPPRTDRHR